MRICFIGHASNYHIIKWATWFSARGHEVHVISFVDGEIDNVTVHYINTGVDKGDSDVKKIGYLLKAGQLNKIVKSISPDIINAHYLTSYGTAVAISGIKHYIVSVWGGDVYDFPRKSPFHNAMVRFSLRRASYVFSTSKAMARETALYTRKKIIITPFGVDMDLFNPDKRSREEDAKFIIGTVKALKPKYGIDVLLRAAKIVKDNYPEMNLEVRIAGDGPQREQYHQLARDLGISDFVSWLGFISQNEAAREWADFDVAIVPSTMDSESFGVSAIEAQASGTALIISDIPGLKEATDPQNRIVVPRNDDQALADAISILYMNKDKRQDMAACGRRYVLKRYEVNKCFEKVEKVFFRICNKD